MKAIDDKASRAIVNVAKLYGALIAKGALSLSILKSTDFAKLSDRLIAFLRLMICTALVKLGSEDDVREAFEKVTIAGDLFDLRDGLHLFLIRYLMADMTGFVESKDMDILQDRIAIAIRCTSNIHKWE